MVCSTPCLPLSVCVRRARRTHTLGWRSLDSVIAVSDQRQQKLADTHMPALCTLIIFLAPEQYFAKVFFGLIANIWSQPFLPSHILSVVSWTLDTVNSVLDTGHWTERKTLAHCHRPSYVAEQTGKEENAEFVTILIDINKLPLLCCFLRDVDGVQYFVFCSSAHQERSNNPLKEDVSGHFR